MTNKLAAEIKGKLVDEYTRCVHYHSLLDVIAIKFKCCGVYYPCYSCHEEEADHEHEVWKKDTMLSQIGIIFLPMPIMVYIWIWIG